jgi:hypothetical protein
MGNNQPLGFGVCQGYPPCNPVANTCPAADSCELVGSSVIGCVPASGAGTGQACAGSPRACARGNICIDLVGGPGPLCYVPCDAAHPCASGSCNLLQGLSFGICQ